MIVRADHVAGAAFIVFALLVIALSGDLPFGTLAMPGAGFMPMLIAVLTILCGLALMIRAGESAPLASLNWSDAKHAALVVIITAAAALLYETLGFILTMSLLIFALLVVIERRNVIRAAVFSIAVTAVTLGLFQYVLQTPLAEGPFGF